MVDKEVNRYKVTIAGESYFLVSDEPSERIDHVAQYVDDRMNRLAQMGHADDPQRLAVLVALQTASQMMEYCERIKEYEDHLEKMIHLLSAELPHKEAAVSV